MLRTLVAHPNQRACCLDVPAGATLGARSSCHPRAARQAKTSWPSWSPSSMAAASFQRQRLAARLLALPIAGRMPAKVRLPWRVLAPLAARLLPPACLLCCSGLTNVAQLRPWIDATVEALLSGKWSGSWKVQSEWCCSVLLHAKSGGGGSCAERRDEPFSLVSSLQTKRSCE